MIIFYLTVSVAASFSTAFSDELSVYETALLTIVCVVTYSNDGYQESLPPKTKVRIKDEFDSILTFLYSPLTGFSLRQFQQATVLYLWRPDLVAKGYDDENIRLATFSQVDASTGYFLASAGFYFVPCQRVAVCPLCGFAISPEEFNHDVIRIHQENSLSCVHASNAMENRMMNILNGAFSGINLERQANPSQNQSQVHLEVGYSPYDTGASASENDMYEDPSLFCSQMGYSTVDIDKAKTLLANNGQEISHATLINKLQEQGSDNEEG